MGLNLMSVAGRKAVGNLVPVDPDNARRQDWIVLLEASTIVGSPRDKLRVALTTRERKVRKKFRLFSKTEYFLQIPGYDPRIHALYFCPQLYKYDDDKLVALDGEEIGRLMVQALQDGASDRQPWYEPLDKLPDDPVVTGSVQTELDSVVVNMPAPRAPTGNKSKSPG
jgi:hypothetical protein